MSVAPAPGTRFPYRTGPSIFSLHERNLPGMNVIVAPRGKIAYVPVPKNACTSLKMFFHGPVWGRPYTGKPDAVHEKFSYATVDFEKFAADRAHFKFLVVREPVARFVSAYNNRVRQFRELSKAWFHSRMPDPQPVFDEFAARGLGFDPDINEFASGLAGYIALSGPIRHHFIAQQNFFHGRPDVFDKIYNIRQLDELAAELARRMDRPAIIPNVQGTGHLKQPARREEIGAAELAAIKTFYEADYRLLGDYL